MEKLEFNIDSSEKSVRIDKYLAECCPDLSRSYLQKLLKDGAVSVNTRIVKANYSLFPCASSTFSWGLNSAII